MNIEIARQLQGIYTGSEIIPSEAKSACIRCKALNFHAEKCANGTYVCGACNQVNSIDIKQSCTSVVNDIFGLKYINSISSKSYILDILQVLNDNFQYDKSWLLTDITVLCSQLHVHI